MSLLNSEAIKLILAHDDVLSEQGKIQSVWNMFTEKMGYQNDAKNLLSFILKNTNEKIISHLYLSDELCSDSISRYHNMIKDIKKTGVSTSDLSNFMYTLDNSLSDYLSINDKSGTNIKINMDGNFDEPSYRDQSIILSAMLKNGLIDSDDIQSLLDDHHLSLLAAANSCVSICRGSESPLNNEEGSGVRITPELSLNDFGTRTEELIGCINALIETGEDLFPKSPSELEKMIFPTDEFDVQKIFHQGTYISNLANYGIISTSLQMLEDSFEMDTETAVYQLSSLMNQLKGFIDYFDKSICLLLYMVTGSMIIRYLNKGIGGNDDKHISAIYTIKKNIANAYSMFIKLDESEPSKISDMVRIPEELNNFVKSTGRELSVDSLFDEDGSDICSDMKAALNDILSGIEEIGATMEHWYGIKASNGATVSMSDMPSALSSLMESSGFEQAQEEYSQTDTKTVTETASKFHSELNRSLLERNFENAANQIALEIALLEQVDNRLVKLSELTPIVETIRRDISTYKERVDTSSKGIKTYQSSANAYIASLFGEDN